MSPKRERHLAGSLWSLYGVLALAGLGLLAEALFVSRTPDSFTFPAPAAPGTPGLRPAAPDLDLLAAKPMTRRITAPVAPPASKAQGVALDSLLRLTGILDFGGKSPSIAVIELPSTGESKGYKAGDAIGETGAVVKEVAEFVLFEHGKRRFKLTFKGVEEMPLRPVGAAEAPRKGNQ